MSNFVPSNKPIRPCGIIYGDMEAFSGERLSLFKQHENSQFVCLLVHSFHLDMLLRLKQSQLKELRDLIDRAITTEETQ